MYDYTMNYVRTSSFPYKYTYSIYTQCIRTVHTFEHTDMYMYMQYVYAFFTTITAILLPILLFMTCKFPASSNIFS